MFGFTFKSIKSEYIFAGYNVRKSFSVVNSIEDKKVVYDSFLYTYLDTNLSFYILMDNGLYKNVDLNIEVPEATAEEIKSLHVARGILKDTSDYDEYDIDKVIGVFGLHNISEVIKLADELGKKDDTRDVSLEAILDVKSQYTGMEVNTIIGKFNKFLKRPSGFITVPPIKNAPDDPYNSLIGDEMDFFDFMSNKDSEQIMDDLCLLNQNVDGIGNVKSDREIVITKGTDTTSGNIEIKSTEE